MANKIITLTIPSEKVQRVIDATKFLHKIPQIADPNWIDPEDGSSAPMINEFTDNQWAKEAWRRYIIAQVKRYEVFKAKEEVNIDSDDTLLA